MATKLQIINLALGHLGEPPVTAIDGDPHPPSVAKALLHWDQALEVALSQAGWLCALESRTLDPVANEAGDWRYGALYLLPAATLRVWNVVTGPELKWQSGTDVDDSGAMRRTIRTNGSGALYVDLVMRRPVEAMTPLLADALSWELASRLAVPIQSSEDKAQWAARRAETAYARAASAEATEIGGEDPMFEPGALTMARASAG